MVYNLNNATFVTMMYQSRVPLKLGERHCPCCDGYAIRPILRGRGQRSQEHEDCSLCDRKGKLAD